VIAGPSVQDQDKDQGSNTEDVKVRKFVFLSLLLGNNESVIPSLLKKSGSENTVSDNNREINNSDALANTTTHSIMYENGQKDGSDVPIITDLRPDGHTQLRMYYTNRTNSEVFPKSWVDITPR